MRISLPLFCVALSLFSIEGRAQSYAPREYGGGLQKLQEDIRFLQYQLKNQEGEIRKLQEEARVQEEIIEETRVKQEEKKSLPTPVVNAEEISDLHNSLQQTVHDIKALRDHLAAQSRSIQQLEKALGALFDALEINNPYSSSTTASRYEVKPGDSLGLIAIKHKTTVKAIKELNHLKNDTIIVGQKLQIPEKK